MVTFDAQKQRKTRGLQTTNTVKHKGFRRSQRTNFEEFDIWLASLAPAIGLHHAIRLAGYHAIWLSGYRRSGFRTSGWLSGSGYLVPSGYLTGRLSGYRAIVLSAAGWLSGYHAIWL